MANSNGTNSIKIDTRLKVALSSMKDNMRLSSYSEVVAVLIKMANEHQAIARNAGADVINAKDYVKNSIGVSNG